MVGLGARPFRPVFVLAAGAVVASAFGASVSLGARQDAPQKQVVLSVLDLRSGRPATAVTAAGLSVREDGQERQVLSVEPFTAPMSLVLLADTTSAFTRYQRELQAASQAFLEAFMKSHPGSTASLWTFGGAGVPVKGPTTDVAELMEAAGKLRPVEVLQNISKEAGSNLLEGVFDASRALGKRPETRRVIVSFNATTPLEASRQTKQQVQDELQKAGVTWLAVSFRDGGSSSPLRETVMTEVLPQSGGVRLSVTDPANLAPAMKSLADILAAQFVVTWARPSGSPKQLQVDARGEGLRVLAPRWAPK